MNYKEKDNIITFSVTSDGATGPEWITRLEKAGFKISLWAKELLNSPDFKSTKGVKYNISVLKGSLFTADNRITSKIRERASEMGLHTPNAEVSCLIRDKFTDKDLENMGLWWIITMHEPIKDSGGDPRLLGAVRYGDGPWLDAGFDRPDSGWDRRSGFAFVAGKNLKPSEPLPKFDTLTFEISEIKVNGKTYKLID